MGIHLKQLHAVFQAVNGGDTGTASLLGVYFDKDEATQAIEKSAPAVPAYFKPAHHYLVTLDGVQMGELPVLAQPPPVEDDELTPAVGVTLATPVDDAHHEALEEHHGKKKASGRK